jgi:general secretion pathway protein C
MSFESLKSLVETFFKKYYWVVNLLVLLLAAWLLAGSVNVVIAHKLRGLPSLASAPTKKQKSWDTPKEAPENNDIIVKLNLFNSALAAPYETLESGPALNEARAQELMDGSLSSLRATLVGTVVASDKDWSFAVITDINNRSTDAYRNGDMLLLEARIVDILPYRVYLDRNGVREYLELQDKSQPKTPGTTPAVAQASDPSMDGIGEGIKKVNEDNYVIQRGEIEKTLSNLNSIAMQARIVPSFTNGESDGFKLFAIRPGSLYSKIGIQNGDVIHKINGFPMNSPDKALEIYQKLKSASSIEVEVTRNGRSKKLNYQIQ